MKIKEKKAFSLVETLLAVSKVILLTIVFFSCIMTSFSYARRVVELRTASLILQEEISAIRNLTFQEVQSLGESFSSPGMSSLNNATGGIIKSAYEDQANIIKITLRVNWTTFNNKEA